MPGLGLFSTIDAESNSIAIIMKHVGGEYAFAVDGFFE